MSSLLYHRYILEVNALTFQICTSYGLTEKNLYPHVISPLKKLSDHIEQHHAILILIEFTDIFLAVLPERKSVCAISLLLKPSRHLLNELHFTWCDSPFLHKACRLLNSRIRCNASLKWPYPSRLFQTHATLIPSRIASGLLSFNKYPEAPF